MRTIVLKLFCWLCLAATTTNILAYQNTNSHSKTDYIETQWRHKLNTKDYSNRYASLLMSSTSSSTTYKPPWSKSENTKTASRSSYSYSYSNTNSNNNNAVRLRHSRYPHLDGVMTRLDKMQPTTKPPTTVSPPPYQHRYQYQNAKNSDKLFYDSYDDDELVDYEDEDLEEEDPTQKDNDDLPDYDNWGNEDDDPNNDDLEDDDDLLDDDDGENGWQAEEATETAPSSLTEYKWQHYGTRSRVEESRRNQNYPEHSSGYAEINAAIQHALKMNKESRCREPSPRVVTIQSEHPDPGKSYMPHCTVLHRCAEDTGCCPNHATKCAPKRQTIVHLYFYTTTVGRQGTRVEKLAFYNHTECACLDKSTAPTTFGASESEASREVSRPYRSNVAVRAADASLFSSPETIRKCKCPEEYTPRLHRGTYCTCDCTDGNLDCALIKRGNEFFSLKDRLCIHNGQCGIPSCEYGAYIRNVGRCPRKQEKIEAFANVPTHVN